MCGALRPALAWLCACLLAPPRSRALREAAPLAADSREKAIAGAVARHAISTHRLGALPDDVLPAWNWTALVPKTASIALHLGHDASVAVSVGDRVQCVLELERLFDKRYYASPLDAADGGEQFGRDWVFALSSFYDACECEDGPCPRHFEEGFIVPYVFSDPETMPGVTDIQEAIKYVVSRFAEVQRWWVVPHHEAHARLGFYSSNFKSALVVSMDAGGNDGYLNVYRGEHGQLSLVTRLDYNLGAAYNIMSAFVPEVSGVPIDETCERFEALPPDDFVRYVASSAHMDVSDSWAGRMMGYSAIADPLASLVEPVVDVFLRSRAGNVNFTEWRLDRSIFERACTGIDGQRALAATTQLVFENMVRGVVQRFLPPAEGQGSLDGIVLSGGCSLNVLANQRVADEFRLPVHVPPASNDGGLPVGALWYWRPPRGPVGPLQYLGLPLWDILRLDSFAEQRGAVRISGPEALAELLTNVGNTSKHGKPPIVAVVRGRQELGPRALGHRSLLAVPYADEVRERLNRLKHRQWYRPVAPMIADEALEQVFGRNVKSPYMEKAPVVTEETRRAFPALAHLDGTARHQSVSREDEPWVHALLTAVGQITGLAALINTSFNTRGLPLVNRVQDCLEMLDTLPDLDFVVIEDWLFAKGSGQPSEASPAASSA